MYNKKLIKILNNKLEVNNQLYLIRHIKITLWYEVSRWDLYQIMINSYTNNVLWHISVFEFKI